MDGLCFTSQYSPKSMSANALVGASNSNIAVIRHNQACLEQLAYCFILFPY